MWDRVERLHEHHGEVPVEVRILKLTERPAPRTRWYGSPGGHPQLPGRRGDRRPLNPPAPEPVPPGPAPGLAGAGHR